MVATRESLHDRGMTQTPHQQRVPTESLRDVQALRRSVTDRKVAGVAGGLGRHLDIDPTVLRVAFVVLCFFGGAGFVLYGAAWLLIPEEGKPNGLISSSPSTRSVLLLSAVAVAAFLLIGNSWGRLTFPWPLAVLALLVIAVTWIRRDRTPDLAPTVDPSLGAPGETSGAESVDQYGDQYGDQPPTYPTPTPMSYQSPPPKPDRGPRLFGPTLALIAIAVGSLWLYDAAGGQVVDSAYPALALAVVGAMLVVGAWAGRAGGLILLGIVSAVALAATAVTNPGFTGDRQVSLAPVSAAQVKGTYFVPAGTVYLDLTQVRDPAALDGRTIDVRANAGQLVVVLPPDVAAHVDAKVSVAGEATITGRTTDGTNVDLTEEVSAVGAQSAHLALNLDLVVGNIEVRQS
jgi:phage shock protein PspC (stress-responsive transcriptional regulator)